MAEPHGREARAEPARPPALLVGSAGEPPDRELVGGKGRSLFTMQAVGARVPAFFVLTTRAWQDWRASGRIGPELLAEIEAGLRWLESATGRSFGGESQPLLVSVRSSGPVSMPGMMDTVLDLGMTPASIAGLLKDTGDLYLLRDLLDNFVDTAAPVFAVVGSETGQRPPIPDGAAEQLRAAIAGVFASWDNDRARLYRRMNGIGEDLGTAVVVQAMVLGNRGRHCGSGVLFTRDPLTGEPVPAGEWAPGRQGEAVVSGTYTPKPVKQLHEVLPDVGDELFAVARALERQARYPQDIEFTVDDGTLYLLQTRDLRLSPIGACRTVIDLLDEQLIGDAEAAIRLGSVQLDDLVVEDVVGSADLDPSAVVATGLAASPGVRTGRVVRTVEEAVAEAATGKDLVLLRPETSPRDIHGMRVAVALVTESGGMTSHAAIVAREMRMPCVSGCGDLSTVPDGTEVTVDGFRGRVYRGRMPVRRTVPPFVDRAVELLERHGSASGRRDTAGPAAEAMPPVDVLRVLLGLAVKGVVETRRVESELVARDGGLAILQQLRDEALVEDMDGYLYLSPEGEAALTRLCQGVVGPLGQDAAIDLLAEFDRLDAELKSLATWWQTERGGAAVTSVTAAVRLVELHEQLDRTTTKYAVLAPLVAPAVGGLDQARRAFLDGDEEMLTGAADESYHSRWFMLHELILRLAGKPRPT